MFFFFLSLWTLNKSGWQEEEAPRSNPSYSQNTDGDGNELLLSDIIGTDEDCVFKRLEKAVDNQLIKESIAKLNKRERKIMELRFGFMTGAEKTQKEVADMLGISQSYISRLEKKIICRMKKEMDAKV